MRFFYVFVCLTYFLLFLYSLFVLCCLDLFLFSLFCLIFIYAFSLLFAWFLVLFAHHFICNKFVVADFVCLFFRLRSYFFCFLLKFSAVTILHIWSVSDALLVSFCLFDLIYLFFGVLCLLFVVMISKGFCKQLLIYILKMINHAKSDKGIQLLSITL